MLPLVRGGHPVGRPRFESAVGLLGSWALYKYSNASDRPPPGRCGRACARAGVAGVHQIAYYSVSEIGGPLFELFGEFDGTGLPETPGGVSVAAFSLPSRDLTWGLGRRHWIVGDPTWGLGSSGVSVGSSVGSMALVHPVHWLDAASRDSRMLVEPGPDRSPDPAGLGTG